MLDIVNAMDGCYTYLVLMHVCSITQWNILSFQKDSCPAPCMPPLLPLECVHVWMRGKLWSTSFIKVEKRCITAVLLTFIQSCVITFNDSLLLLFDLSKGQPSGLLRFVDQPGVGRNTSTCSWPFIHQRRPVKRHHNHTYFPKCFHHKKLKFVLETMKLLFLPKSRAAAVEVSKTNHPTVHYNWK